MTDHSEEVVDPIPAPELETDGCTDVSAVFTRLCELNIEAGNVPADGSGVDRVLTRTIEARDRDRDWNVALNGNTNAEQSVQDFPDDGDETTIPAARAVIYLGRLPVGVLGPHGGQLLCDQDGVELLSPEDEILRDLETQLLDMGADLDRTIPDVATDGGEDVVTIQRERAETLLEAAGTLRDDIASGRQWGFDADESRQNAGDLEDAHAELQDELRTQPAENDGGER